MAEKLKKLHLLCYIVFLLLLMAAALPCTVTAEEEARIVKVALPVAAEEMDEMSLYTKAFLDKLSEYTKWKIEYITFDDSSLDQSITQAMEMVQNGEADLLGSILKNDATEEMYIFPKESYGKMYTTLLALDSSTITKLNCSFEENPLRVAVLEIAKNRNNETISYLDSCSFEYQIIEYTSEEEQLKALENGEADVMTGVSSQNIPNTRVVEKFAPRFFYTAFSPKDQELADEFDKAYRQLTAVQPFYIDELAERYFENEHYEYDSITISDDILPENGTIRVLGVDGDAPFFFLDENKKPAGLLYELLNDFAKKTDQQIELDLCDTVKERDERLTKKEYDFVIGCAFTSDACQQYGFIQSTPISTETLSKVYRNSDDLDKKDSVTAVIYGTKSAKQAAGENVKVYENPEEVIKAIEKDEADVAWMISACSDFYIEKLDASVKNVAIYDSKIDVSVSVNKNLSEKYIALFNLYIKSISNEQLTTMLQDANRYANATPMQVFIRHHLLLVIVLSVIFIAAIMLVIGLLIYIRMKETKAALERENRLNKHQLSHDSLTGVLNRQGYNEMLEQCRKDKRPFAFIQLDIDNFKILNDTYGHAFGDEVLKKVAEQLMEAFRAEDYVFRFGGDEFAVLLSNCNVDAWNSIAQKQRMIHIRMNQIFQRKIYVTLSMGVSWSESGFTEDIVALADEALYQIKRNGRAGCCVIDKNHKVIFEWKDEMGNNTETDPLTQSDTGAYRMEFPNGNMIDGKLICNETARALLGFSEKMTPKECYSKWISRIDPAFKKTVMKTQKEMINKGKAECTYIYQHPTQGHIMMRSGGKCVHNKDGIAIYGYHQSLQGTSIVLPEDCEQ